MSHYETLEVSRNASPAVIRAAYRSLMQRYHPDKNPNNAKAAAMAQQVAVAYAVLSEPDKRLAYDARLFDEEGPSASMGTPRHAASVDVPAPLSTRRKAEIPGQTAKPTGKSLKTLLGTVAVVASILGVFTLASIKTKEASDRAFDSMVEKLEIESEKLILQANEATRRKTAEDEALDLSRRTLFLFPKNIALNLIRAHSYPPQFTGQVLEIAEIGVIVGKIDSEAVIANIQKNQLVLTRDVLDKLSRIDERKLLTVDAEKHIQDVIQDTMNIVILGRNYQEGKICNYDLSSPLAGNYEWQCRAIQAVKLPQSFILKAEGRVDMPSTSSRTPSPLPRLHPSMSKEEIYRVLGSPAQ